MSDTTPPVKLRVKAIAGIRVPREGQPQRHITDSQEAEVVDSAYYRRRIADGDLVEQEPREPRRRVKHRPE